MQMLQSNGCEQSQVQIAELVGKALERAATIPTAHNAYHTTQILSLDPDTFSEATFALTFSRCYRHC